MANCFGWTVLNYNDSLTVRYLTETVILNGNNGPPKSSKLFSVSLCVQIFLLYFLYQKDGWNDAINSK